MSLSKLTKYCACHEKWISWLILVTHETLFTMRGVTSVIVQTHQILRLPRKNESHDWSLSHMKRYLQCAEQQVSLSKLTKYCACHEKMNLMIDPCHTWNALYNARSNKCHCPNSPNTAPATKNESLEWSLSHMKRYLQCAGTTDGILAPATQNDSPKFRKKFSKTAETSFPMRGRSEQDPSRIRAGSENETVSPATRLATEAIFSRPPRHILYWKIQHFALRLSFQISPNSAPATKSDTWTSQNTAPCCEKYHSSLILFTHETLFTMRASNKCHCT